MKENIIIVLIIILLLLGVAGVTAGIGWGIEKYVVCPRIGAELQMPYKYNFWAGGCFIQMDNEQWIKEANYRGVNIEN